MIISEINAGLGNQLFQYANAKNLSIKYNQELKLDLEFYKTWKNPDVFRLDKFNTNYTIANKEEIELFKRKKFNKNRLDIRLINKIIDGKLYKNNKYHIDEKTYRFDKHKLNNPINLYLSGYWGNEKYFKDIEDVIRSEFTLKDQLNKENQLIQKQIQNSNAISLHIRRGDYVRNPYFANIPAKYYEKSVDFFKKKYNNSVFFVFSDDLNWVKDNLKLNASIYYVDVNNTKTDYMDLMLIASCKHNIIANSTFSWWGAWLNDNPDKIVIAPKVWYNDKAAQSKYENGTLIPNTWIKI